MGGKSVPMHLWYVLSMTAAAHSLPGNALFCSSAGDANNLVILQSQISSPDKSYSPLKTHSR